MQNVIKVSVTWILCKSLKTVSNIPNRLQSQSLISNILRGAKIENNFTGDQKLVILGSSFKIVIPLLMLGKEEIERQILFLQRLPQLSHSNFNHTRKWYA